MKNKFLIFLFSCILLSGCIGTSSSGLFGTGVTIAMDPRTLGTQIDDSIMDKSLETRILGIDKKYFLSVKAKVLDGRIFLTGKVDSPDEKLKLTKVAWSAMIFNKKIKSVNYNIDSYKKVIYIYGIARTEDERKEVIKESKEILDVEDVVASILLVDDLRVQKK